VAKGTVYLYYRSKRSIYWAALQEGIAELDARTRERVRRAATLQDAIRDFILTKVEYFDERREFFRVYVLELSGQAARPAYGHPAFRPLYHRQRSHRSRNVGTDPVVGQRRRAARARAQPRTAAAGGSGGRGARRPMARARGAVAGFVGYPRRAAAGSEPRGVRIPGSQSYRR